MVNGCVLSVTHDLSRGLQTNNNLNRFNGFLIRLTSASLITFQLQVGYLCFVTLQLRLE